MLKRTTIREIRQSFGRYVAILSIVALGVGFFAGLKEAKPYMSATTDQYLKEQGLYDIRLLSTLGFVKEDVDAFRKEKGVQAAQGSYTYDILCTGIDENEVVLKAHSLTEGINGVTLKEGRMPENEDECVADARLVGREAIGTKLTLTDDNEEDTLDAFAKREYTVVGTVDASAYINFERGTTSLGSGRVAGFLYLLPEAFAGEYYTEVYIKLDHDYVIYSDEYEDFMDRETDAWDGICKERVDIRYENVLSEARKELADAKEELAEQKAEAKEELADAKKELADAGKEIEDGEKELADGERELADGRRQLADAKETVAKEEQELADAKKEMEEQQRVLDGQGAQLPAPEALAYAMGIPIEQARAQVEAARGQLAAGGMKLAEAGERVREAEQELADAKREITEKEQELADGKKELATAKQELADAKEELAEGLLDYEEANAEFEEEIADAEQKITDAQAEIDDIKEPDYYILDRNSNIGYVCFESDSDIVAGIADIFPVFFFMVAALVCITTMNRMVEEQRTQIGVLKALGYTEAAIMSKYMFYAGSAAVAGCIGGYLGGTWLFPRVIWAAYGIMYNMPGLLYTFDLKLALVSLAVSLLCSMGATWFSCRYELTETAAQLMRPKAPRAGKRVFLEKVPFIWRRLKFLQKVSVRNVVRYKKRFFMMVIGISGCTALLVTGFGLEDSVAGLAGQQFEEIQISDGSVNLKEDRDADEEADLADELARLTENHTPVYEGSWDLLYDGRVKSLSLVIPQKPEEIAAYVDFHTVQDEPIAFPGEGEAVISHKIAEIYGIFVGSRITLRNEDMEELTVTVSGIFENFVMNYVYLSPQTYRSLTGKEPDYRTLYVNYREGGDAHEAAASLMQLDAVSSITVNRDTRERFDGMMGSLNYVVLLVILCAAALAFIVLYNLTNINITERIREIATIKVLGFYKNETASYVFRENMALTAIGACVGMVLGYFLHGFIMSRINVDMVAFDVHILPVSYGYSILLTFFFNFMVNGVMSFKLEKINMAESLKSVD